MILGNVLGGDSSSIVDGVGSVISAGGSTTAGASSLMGAIEESSSVIMGDLILGGSAAATAEPSSSAFPLLDTTHFKPLLQSSIAVVSELAVITSLIGVVLGFVNEFNDAVETILASSSSPSSSSLSPASKSYGPTTPQTTTSGDDKKWRVALLTLLPPAIVSVALGYYASSSSTLSSSSGTNDVNNYQIIDYTGIFGSSVLFLILPALMAWQNRYGEVDDPPRPLTVRPMVPLGKIPLGSLYKAAATLIIEQGLDKLGVFEFVKEHLLWKT